MLPWIFLQRGAARAGAAALASGDRAAHEAGVDLLAARVSECRARGHGEQQQTTDKPIDLSHASSVSVHPLGRGRRVIRRRHSPHRTGGWVNYVRGKVGGRLLQTVTPASGRGGSPRALRRIQGGAALDTVVFESGYDSHSGRDAFIRTFGESGSTRGSRRWCASGACPRRVLLAPTSDPYLWDGLRGSRSVTWPECMR